MALVGIELVTHVSEPDALTTRPPPCAGTRRHRTFSLQYYTMLFETVVCVSFSNLGSDLILQTWGFVGNLRRPQEVSGGINLGKHCFINRQISNKKISSS